MALLKNVALLFFLAAVTTVLAKDFRLRLAVEGGQVRELVLGIQEKATDGIDPELDILVPPFGMGTGIVGLVPDGQENNLLYRDIRGPSLPKTWRVSLAPANRSIVLNWKIEELPPDTDCQLEYEGAKIDMRRLLRLSVKKKTILTLTISPRKKP